MSQSRAASTLSDESSGVYSQLRASQRANRSYITVADISRSKEKGPTQPGMFIVLRCASASPVSRLNLEHFTCVAPLRVGKTVNVLHRRGPCFLRKSPGIHFGLATGASCNSFVIFMFSTQFGSLLLPSAGKQA